MSLTAEHLRQILHKQTQIDASACYVVAYSGGVDSHVLLHLCKSFDLNLKAVHINHGLQSESKKWAKHCEQQCKSLSVEYESIDVDVDIKAGGGPEAEARKSRYAALAACIDDNHVLLTAHHADDQAETLFLQLMRGAGPAGLSGMPACTRFAHGWHMRPLLGFTREDIRDYAQEHHLDWAEDPSNSDINYDRNLLRVDIIPVLKHRWPALPKTLLHVSEVQSESRRLQDELAAIDLNGVETDQLPLKTLAPLGRHRQKNVLRFWIKQRGFDNPTRQALDQLIDCVLTAAEDANPVVHWKQTEIRRYRGELYVIRVLGKHDNKQVLSWDTTKKLVNLSIGKKIGLQKEMGKGISPSRLPARVEIRFRTGGESIRPTGRKETHQLKTLFQEAGVPPWLRDRIPLIYIDNKLVCVCGYWFDDSVAAGKDETGLVPVLTRLIAE